jgi:hypothetical protein
MGILVMIEEGDAEGSAMMFSLAEFTRVAVCRIALANEDMSDYTVESASWVVEVSMRRTC